MIHDSDRVAVPGPVVTLLQAVRNLVHEQVSKTSEKQVANTLSNMNHISGGCCQRSDGIRKSVFRDTDSGEIHLKKAL
jgi:hypothetical protein